MYDNYKVLLEAASQADVLDGMLVDRFYHLFQTHVFHAYNLKIVGAISSPAVHGILVYNDPENPSLTSCLSGYVASHKFSIYDYIESLLQAAEVGIRRSYGLNTSRSKQNDMVCQLLLFCTQEPCEWRS